MYSNTANFGKICVPCIKKALQNAVGEYTVRISCHQEAFFAVRNYQIMHGVQILPFSGDLGFSAARHLPWKTGCAPCLGGTGVGHKKGDPCGSPFCSCWLGMSRPSWLDASRAALARCESIGPDGMVGLPVGHGSANSGQARQPGCLHKRRRRCQAGSSRSLRGRSSRSRGSSGPR